MMGWRPTMLHCSDGAGRQDADAVPPAGRRHAGACAALVTGLARGPHGGRAARGRWLAQGAQRVPEGEIRAVARQAGGVCPADLAGEPLYEMLGRTPCGAPG